MDIMLQKYLELRNRLTNEEGQTMAEYGLLLADNMEGSGLYGPGEGSAIVPPPSP